MANKQYISPIRLLQFCGIDTEGELNLSRIKKQLVAEFAMAANGFIETDGFTYNKTDVLEELDQPDFTERWAFHQSIWATPALLNLLEKNEIEVNKYHEPFVAFQNNPAFDAFISPYFAAPYNYVLRNLLNSNQLADTAAWLALDGFLQPLDREEAFKPLRIFLEENMRLLRNINQDNYASFRPKLLHWLTPGWSNSLNAFPDDFYDEKHELVVLLINLTVRIQKSDRSDCQRISAQLTYLNDLSTDLRETIQSNDAVYNSAAGTSSKSSGGNNYGWIIWVAIILLRIISHGGCN